MSEITKVEKAEREVDAFSALWRKRPRLAFGFALLVLVPVGWGAVERFVTIPRLEGKISSHAAAAEKLKGKLDDTRRELDAMTSDRDAKASQLAPFLAVAHSKFGETQQAPENLLRVLGSFEQALEQRLSELEPIPPTGAGSSAEYIQESTAGQMFEKLPGQGSSPAFKQAAASYRQKWVAQERRWHGTIGSMHVQGRVSTVCVVERGTGVSIVALARSEDVKGMLVGDEVSASGRVQDLDRGSMFSFGDPNHRYVSLFPATVARKR